MSDAASERERQDGALVSIEAQCDLAIAALKEARTLPEVLKIQATAEALRVYAVRIKAARAAQNGIARVIFLAEARVGAELEAAQARGELQRPGGDRGNQHTGGKVPDGANATPKIADVLGSRKAAAQAKQMHRAGPAAIEREVAEATAQDRPASRQRILNPRRPTPAPPPQAPAPAAAPPPSPPSPLSTDAPDPASFSGTARARLEQAIEAHKRRLDRELEGRIHAEVTRRLEEWRQEAERTVGIRIAALEKRATQAEATVAALRGRFPHNMFRLLLEAVHPDRWHGSAKEARATEAFQYLTDHRAALAMTPEEEAAKIAAVKREAEQREWMRRAAAMRAAQEAERKRKAAERRAARKAQQEPSA
ncbi:hypothetical protein J5Y09_18740 [Roseomonas sp. PWR1]|uniref:Uncharacterized protein n=1 Tax=Roseomonas nitratireducens TaxID=2820810 RepID=A0ABS4AYZ6_9PROT|nr:hypothetical protein [Neoroseomonas nitratireducens]MBP0465971.1 hypothetical protein [Neoroseomonas nitratireducens]